MPKASQLQHQQRSVRDSRSHLWPGYQYVDFYQLEITLHVRFYSDLFTVPRHAGKEGAFTTAVMGHSEWQDWRNQDVCVVTARHSHSTGAAANAGS